MYRNESLTYCSHDSNKDGRRRTVGGKVYDSGLRVNQDFNVFIPDGSRPRGEGEINIDTGVIPAYEKGKAGPLQTWNNNHRGVV